MTAVVQHQLAIVQSGAGRQLGLAGIHDKADTTAAKILHLHLYTVAVAARIAQPQFQLAMQAAGPPQLEPIVVAPLQAQHAVGQGRL